MTLESLMDGFRKWESDLAELMRDHADYRERLDAAVRAFPCGSGFRPSDRASFAVSPPDGASIPNAERGA